MMQAGRSGDFVLSQTHSYIARCIAYRGESFSSSNGRYVVRLGQTRKVDRDKMKQSDDGRRRRSKSKAAATYVPCQKFPVSDVGRHMVRLAGQTRLEPPLSFRILLQPGQCLA